MTLIQSLILGIIQGLTEFLPISSSAHLVLVPYLFGWQIPEAQIFPFDVLVQLGTLGAVIIYFWKDLWSIVRDFFKALVARQPFGSENARLGWYLILATIPAGLAGVLIKDVVEAAFNSVTATAIFLFATALLLVLAELLGKRTRSYSDIKWLDALVIGLFQMISLFPGVSRSGSTIVGGMFRKLERPAAARFSFLMAVPVMLGAGLVSLKDALEMPGFGDFLPVILVGFIAALLVGYLAIHWFLTFLGKRSLYVFAIYCALLGALILTIGLLKKEPAAQASTHPAIEQTLAATAANVDTAADVVTVAYISSLAWMAPVMDVCTRSFPALSIVTSEVPAESAAIEDHHILLRWGATADLPASSYVLGYDDLALVVNPQNPLASLTPALISSIYLGEVTTWSEAAAQCPECFANSMEESFASQLIALYAYSTATQTQSAFTALFMNNLQQLSSAGVLVPDEEAMIAEVASQPAALGFAPAHFTTDGVKAISVTTLDPARSLTLPVIAVTNQPLPPVASQWLTCIQNVLEPKR